MKQTGIVDRFEDGYVVVEVGDTFVNFPREETPPMLAEGMVVFIVDMHNTGIDYAETQRIEEDMRRRFVRIIGTNEE